MSQTETAPRYLREFPDYPADSMPTIPESFEDCSWHNDVCPSFVSDSLGLWLFIDYPNGADREFKGYPRFRMIEQEHGVEMGTWHFDSDDWEAILSVIETFRIAKKWVDQFGCGFHPDTRGREYHPALTESEAQEYDRDMAKLFASPVADPYEIALKTMQKSTK